MLGGGRGCRQQSSHSKFVFMAMLLIEMTVLMITQNPRTKSPKETAYTISYQVVQRSGQISWKNMLRAQVLSFVWYLLVPNLHRDNPSRIPERCAGPQPGACRAMAFGTGSSSRHPPRAVGGGAGSKCGLCL